MERNVVLIALFTAMIAALGLLPKLTLASGIPITAQSMGVMLCGTVLGAKRGALAVLLFLLLVAAGLPLLTGGRGGLGVFTTPWAGFYIGFPLAAFVAGLVMQTWQRGNITVIAIVAAVIGGIGAMYLAAVPYYMLMKPAGLGESLLTVMAPFVPGDLIKAVVAGLITGALYKARPASVLSRS
ncbi:biotin transporter BioY [Leisingera sp.]|jgi:biotin transport system substrate-specific component|uniref:biotin transporter BioY n=1 Tax=Leisingera sp. TaxID=1879318 RepID=UPI003A8F5856